MAYRGKTRRQRVVKDHDGTTPEETPSVFERRFWLFVAGVILVSMITCVFDFTLVPPIYNTIQVTQPFCGLHSWHEADRAWAARNHVKYGLAYTKGFRTLMVADPPRSDRPRGCSDG